MANAKRDDNRVTVLMGVSNADGTTLLPVQVDSATNRILASATVAGSTTITVANEATDVTCFPVFVTAATGDLGPKTNAALTFNSATGQLGATSLAPTSIELGHATDTTLARAAAGVVSIEGVNIVTTSSTDTLTNKTLTSPTLTAPILGTPASGTLTNCTGLPVAGITSSTVTALGVGSLELGAAADTTLTRVSAGLIAVEGVTVVDVSTIQTLTNKTLTSPVFTAPALGTPASGNLANCTALPVSGITSSTVTALGVGSLELGHATDTSITRVSAGLIAVEGINVVDVSTIQTLTNKTLTSPTLTTPVLGTPSSGNLTNCTALPVAGITASTVTALGVGSLELGHATDTSIARVSAGVVSIEGVNIVTTSSADTLTNKTLTSPTLTTPALGTPASGVLTNCTGLPVAGGGTGAATFTDAGVLIGNGTGAVQVTTAGSAGQVLTSNGAGVDPTFQAAAGANPGWDFVSYNTGSSATITVSSLGLDAANCYQVIVDYDSTTGSPANAAISMTLNNVGSSVYNYIYMGVQSADSYTSPAASNGGAASTSSFALSGPSTSGCPRHHFEIYLFERDADGNRHRIIWNGGGSRSGAVAASDPYIVQGSGEMQSAADMTRFDITSSGANPSWKVWVFAAAQS